MRIPMRPMRLLDGCTDSACAEFAPGRCAEANAYEPVSVVPQMSGANCERREVKDFPARLLRRILLFSHVHQRWSLREFEAVR